MRTVRIAAVASVLLAACADPTDPGLTAEAAVPTVAEIVCEADGSTTVRTPEVLAQPDGVHLEIVSHLDEPASVGGLGPDVDPGATDWVSTRAPGKVDAACYPYSQHGSSEGPAEAPIRVLDPNGYYVDGELQCSGTGSSTISDFAEAPIDVGPVPIEEARAAIRGLEDDDEVFHVGYREQADAGVAVRRHGQVVATFSFSTFDGEEWVIEGSSICESSGLGHA